jgi:lipopolysaccharide export system protein LptA
MKTFIILLLAGSCGIVRAQTNAPVPDPPESQTEIFSDSGHFDGNKYQMIYLGHVFAAATKSKLHCGQLTVDLPPDGGHPTNIIAEFNVVIDVLDKKGQTNHLTADKAVYTYGVVGAVTNEGVVFTGSNPSPKVENSQVIIEGDPLVLNLVTRQFSGEHYRTFFKKTTSSGTDTNASPLDFFK